MVIRLKLFLMYHLENCQAWYPTQFNPILSLQSSKILEEALSYEQASIACINFKNQLNRLKPNLDAKINEISGKIVTAGLEAENNANQNSKTERLALELDLLCKEMELIDKILNSIVLFISKGYISNEELTIFSEQALEVGDLPDSDVFKVIVLEINKIFTEHQKNPFEDPSITPNQ